MDPFPRPERPTDENQSHEKLAWPWEKSAEKEAKTKKKPDGKEKKEEPKKKPERLEKEKKPEPKKEEKSEKPAEPDPEKRERRSTLVEQSIALVAKYEEEPIPRDASLLARVMIAHQVLDLHNQLEQADQLQGDVPPEEIKATLDYIAQLDAKFQNPNNKAGPEIEQSYQEIMELAERTLEEESDLETVVAEMNSQTPNNPEPTGSEPLDPFSAGRYLQPESKATSGPDFSPDAKPSSNEWDRRGNQKKDSEGTANKSTQDRTQEEFTRRQKAARETLPAVATASALVYLITHLGRKKRKSQFHALTSEQIGEPMSDTPAPSAEPSSTLPKPALSDGPDFGPSSYSRPAVPHVERSSPAMPTREHIPVPPRRASPLLAATAMATAFAVNRSSGEKPSITSLDSHPLTPYTPYETKLESPRPIPSEASTLETTSTSSSDRKIEHMSLLQLLSMAENVSLGHGRYLRREFESGQIDKEGLVKILKAHSKGRDYQFEFRQQAGRFAKLKATSPEFLHQTKPVKSDADTSSKELESQPVDTKTEAVKKDTQPTRPLSLAPPTKHDLLPEFTDSIHQPENTGRRLVFITVAALAGLILIGWLAISIFNALN